MKWFLILILSYPILGFSRLDHGRIYSRAGLEDVAMGIFTLAGKEDYYIYGLKEFPVNVCVRDDYLQSVFVEAISLFHKSWHRWVTLRSSPTIHDYQHKIPPIKVFRMACYENSLGGPIVRVFWDDEINNSNETLAYVNYAFNEKANIDYVKIGWNRGYVDRGISFDYAVLVALHELFHAVGVPHNNTFGSLMYYDTHRIGALSLYDYDVDDQTFFDFVKPYFVLGGDE